MRTFIAGLSAKRRAARSAPFPPGMPTSVSSRSIGPGCSAAIAAEHPGPIDLLLTDVVMPGGNGADLAARLSALRPAMKVLMMTGYAQETIADQGGLKAGIVLIEKPFSPNLLLARVRMAIDAEAGPTVARSTDTR